MAIISPTWTNAPPVSPLIPQWVHVFKFDLALPSDRLRCLEAFLSHEERNRANRFRFSKDRDHFVASRGQLRQVLSIYTKTNPEHISIMQNAYGKPCLPEPAVVKFNLTHSGSLGLLAVTNNQEVGIDLEDNRRKVDFMNIARRYFAVREARVLENLPGELRPAAFFACWTRKEAFVKAQGQGLHIPLSDFEVTLAPGELARIVIPAQGWSLTDLDPGPGYTAALVVEGAINGVHTFHWNPGPP